MRPLNPELLKVAMEAGEDEEKRIGGILEKNPVLREAKYRAAISKYLDLLEDRGVVFSYHGQAHPTFKKKTITINDGVVTITDE